MKTIISILSTMLLTGVVSAAIVYAIEYNQSPLTIYYGSVPIKDSYTYPELIESVSFTTPKEGKPVDIEFLNILWCYPIGDVVQDYFPYATRRKFYKDFSYFNDLPPRDMVAGRRAITEPLNGGLVNDGKVYNGQIQQADVPAIRANMDKYTTWFLDDIRPDFGATCYIESKSTTFTRLFKLRKEIEYKSISFDYLQK